MLVSLLLFVGYVKAQDPVQLNPDIISIIDGKSFGIHGELVGAVYKIIRDVQSMQYGRRTATGRVGLYTFEGRACGIKALAELESSLIKGLDKAISKAQKDAVLARLDTLKQMLNKLKEDFCTIVNPFMGQARGAKEPMFKLISESCIKRNRPKSLLLNWAHSKDGQEMESFDKSVTNFVLFDEFMTDLADFLGDLVSSCPKARAQFEQLKQEYMRKIQSNKVSGA